MNSLLARTIRGLPKINWVQKPANQIAAASLNRFIHSNATMLVDTPSEPIATANFSDKTKQLVNQLRDQTRYYAVVEIKGRKYTITELDNIVLNRNAELQIGDKIKLNQVLELGSKDFSIVGEPLVSKEYFNIEATVMEHCRGPNINIIKHRPRKGYRREYNYRNYYTILKISKLEVNKL